MHAQSKRLEIAILIVFVMAGTAIMVPPLFNNLVAQQTIENRALYQSIRIILIVIIIFFIIAGGAKLVEGMG